MAQQVHTTMLAFEQHQKASHRLGPKQESLVIWMSPNRGWWKLKTDGASGGVKARPQLVGCFQARMVSGSKGSLIISGTAQFSKLSYGPF